MATEYPIRPVRTTTRKVTNATTTTTEQTILSGNLTPPTAAIPTIPPTVQQPDGNRQPSINSKNSNIKKRKTAPRTVTTATPATAPTTNTTG
jgi:hypothetical protein